MGEGTRSRGLRSPGHRHVSFHDRARPQSCAGGEVPHTGSFLESPLPECVAVTSIGECFNYLFDPSNCQQLLARLFRRVYTALQPGGLLVFDILEPGSRRGTSLQRRFREGKDWAVLSEIEEDRKLGRLTRRITTFRRVGKLYRRGSEIHRQQLYQGSELAKELRRAGFSVTRLRGYGQLQFSGSHIGFLAVKPGARTKS